jgi:hypothetical protein
MWTLHQTKKAHNSWSVLDLRRSSRIPNLGFDFFPSRIPDTYSFLPGSRIRIVSFPDPGSASKNFIRIPDPHQRISSRIPDPHQRISSGSRIRIKEFHPGSRIRIKELKYFNQINAFVARIRILTFYPSGSSGQKDTGYRIRNTE